MAKKRASMRDKPKAPGGRPRSQSGWKAGLAAFAEASTDAFVLFDANLDVVAVNRAAEKLAVLSKAGLGGSDGRNILDHAPALEKLGRYRQYRDVMDTGQPLSYDHVVEDAESGRRYLNIRAFKVGDGLGLKVSDVTERRQVEEALREREERLSNVFASTQDMVYRLDLRAVRYDYISPVSERVLGYTPEEFMTIGFDGASTLVHPDDLEHLTHNMFSLMNPSERHAARMIEYRMRHRTLGYRWMSDSRTVIDDDQGRPIAVVGSLRDVTERKAAEEALRESERRYRDLADLLPMTVFEVDRDGFLTFLNRKGLEASGYDRQEVGRGFEVYRLLVPEDRERAAANLLSMLNAAQSTGTEYAALRRDGTSFPVLIHSSVIVRDGQPAGLRGIGIDLTERRQAEDALRHQEEYFRSLIENSSDLIAVIGGDGNLRYESPSVARLTGHEQKERLGRSAFDLVHPDDLTDVGKVFAELLERPGSSASMELRFRYKDGSWRVMEGTGQNFLHHPAIQGIVINVRDITERKRAEEELTRYRFHLEELVGERTRELQRANERLKAEIDERTRMEEEVRAKERWFRALIENSMDFIAVVGADGALRYGSPAATAALGFDEARGGEGTTLDLVHPDDMPRASQGLARLLRRPASVARAEVRARHRNGSWRTLEVVGKNLLDDPVVRGIVANFRDITERKKSERKLRRLYDRERGLREQIEVEMGKRVEFTRALAHELKTPLTPVVMSSQILASKLKDDLLLRVAKNIERGASNLNSRIDELLDLARGEVGMLHIRRERVDLLELLKEVMEEVSAVPAGRGQRLELKLPPELPEVSADRVRVRQVVMNLLNNAFKYTPGGERITLRAKQDDGDVVVEVRDTGPGIEKEELERLFNPYHRIDSDREQLSGLGLGLALCKTLVELHGGRIWARSRVGKGSTFSFSLPVGQFSE